MKIFDELKRRNVIKATIAYIVVAWVLLQVIAIVLPNFEAPLWVFKTLTFVIIIGLPVWIIFSWVYEITPEGLKRTSKVLKENAITETTNKRLNVIIIITLIIAIGVSFINRPEPIISSRAHVVNDLVADNSIAVLPFINMSNDIEQEYFADGLSEELINMFTLIPELKVIGRSSSFAFKGKNEDLRKIGKSLGVQYLLGGSVRKSGNKIRITCQLIKSKDGTHLWSETFDRNLGDIFEIQDEISTAVTSALRITLSKNKSFSKQKIRKPEAYNYFLRGKYFYEIGPDHSYTDKAIEWFQESIKSDSTYSLPWTYLGMCYWRKSNNSLQDNFIKAKKASMKALNLDPTSGIAAVNIGEILDNEYDFRGALRMIDLALKLEPNDPYVLRNAGRFYTILGRKEESIAYCQSALKNDPIQRTALNYLINAFYYAEQYDSVKQIINKYKDLYPNIINLNVLTSENDFLMLIEQAKKNNNELIELFANVLIISKSGNKSKLDELLAQMINNFPSRPYFIALTYASIGEDTKAIDWLEKAFIFKDKDLVYVNVEPKFNSLMDNNRFKDLIKKMNFP